MVIFVDVDDFQLLLIFIFENKRINYFKVHLFTSKQILSLVKHAIGDWSLTYEEIQVQAAYKRALLKFHPDRAPQCDIRQQVEAEEKFKLINRLKEKLLPSW